MCPVFSFFSGPDCKSPTMYSFDLISQTKGAPKSTYFITLVFLLFKGFFLIHRHFWPKKCAFITCIHVLFLVIVHNKFETLFCPGHFDSKFGSVSFNAKELTEISHFDSKLLVHVHPANLHLPKKISLLFKHWIS